MPKISELPPKTPLSGAETFPIVDSGTTQKATLSDVVVMALNPMACGLRLSLTTAVPVTTTDVTAATTVYFTPYKGAQLSLYYNNAWILVTTAEVSLALGTLTADKNYDVFAYWTGSAVTLELSAAWTTDIARADALTRQSGVLVKSSDTTRRYLGTVRTTTTTTVEDSRAKRYVWNAYNQERRFMRIIEATASWSHGSASWRASNNNAANAFEYVSGDLAAIVTAVAYGLASASSITSTAAGVGVDSTTVNSATVFGADTAVNLASQRIGPYTGYPGLGYHKITWLEYGASGATFYGAPGAAYQAGMVGELMA